MKKNSNHSKKTDILKLPKLASYQCKNCDNYFIKELLKNEIPSTYVKCSCGRMASYEA